RKQYPLLKTQNPNSQIFNNAALTITSHNNGRPFPQGQNVGNNYQVKDLMLVDKSNFDFRPKPGSPLIDAGREIAGFTDGFKGKAPDIGAYEYGGEKWTAGITWQPKNK
ncbi:MAG: choice-of-anchor Q domain-containing protein, partial [Planctomycetota bacterium]